MKIVALCRTRDEADLIEPFVRHTLALVDSLVVMENGSTDGTAEILRSLVDEGLRLEVVEDPSTGFYQQEKTTALMKHALGRAPDWLLVLDTDELLVPTDGEVPRWVGRPALEEASGPLALEWYTHVPDPADDPAEQNPLLRLRHRLVERSGPQWTKVAVPGALAALEGAQLSMGNHAMELDGAPVPATLVEGALAHFPVRRFGQFSARVCLNRLQALSRDDWWAGWSTQYLRSFESLSADPQRFYERYAEDAIRWYSEVGAPGEAREEAPLRYLGGPLRYARPGAGGLAAAVKQTLALSASIARRHAEAQRARKKAEAARDTALQEARAAEERALLGAAAEGAAVLRAEEAAQQVLEARQEAQRASALATLSDEARRAAEQASAEARAQAARAEAAAQREAQRALEAEQRLRASELRALEAGRRLLEAWEQAQAAEARAASAEQALAGARQAIDELASSSAVRLARLLEQRAPRVRKLVAAQARGALRALELLRRGRG